MRERPGFCFVQAAKSVDMPRQVGTLVSSFKRKAGSSLHSE